MTRVPIASSSGRTAKRRMIALVSLSVTLVMLCIALAAPAQAAPLAGTSIGNQASATYTDNSNVVRTATSNTTQTVVQQVASLSLSSTQTKVVAPGGTVYYPHTLSNTGNGTDTFSLAAVDAGTGTITFTNLAIYPDANGDGVPDNFTAITSSGPLAAGASFTFIVAATVPGTVTASNNETITLTATSGFTPAQNALNTDTVTVSSNAIINMTKSVTPGSANAGTGPVIYTLTYTNTGNATATGLTITDIIPAGVTYNTGSGGNHARWSVTSSTALTDAVDAPQVSGAYTIDYSYSAGASTVTAIINQVLPGETRTLTFEVNIPAGTLPGTVSNTASFSYNDGSTTATGSTNPATLTVNQAASVVVNNVSGSTSNGGSFDDITVNSAPQGGTVTFNAYVHNSGNGSDSFDISVVNGTFPSGTTFNLFKSDGVTPLIDTNGNSTPDTGALAADGTYQVVVKAILPAGSTGGPFSATVTGVSKFDGSKSDPANLILTAITANTVDLTINTARSDSTPAGSADSGNAATTGFGPGPEATAVSVQAANPGTTSTFAIKVNNTSGIADTFNLAVSQNTTFSPASLPSGWSVTFRADASGVAANCSTTGAVISNTGVVNAGANSTVCAVVSVPANASAGTRDLYFRALSPTSGAIDTLHSGVLVNTVRALSVTNNQSGQVFPGGTVVYPMTVTNNGNVTEGTVATAGTPNGSSDSKVILGLADSLVAQGWTSVLYHDVNGNNQIDSGEPVIVDLADIGGLTPGQSASLLLKVFAPAGAGIGDSDATTLTATTTGVISGAAAPAAASATATSSVISGQVTLTKLQALDAACDGTADTSYALTTITTGAVPGACILYQVTAKNVGTAGVSGLVVSDSTPENTVYNAGTDCPTTGGASVAATTVGTVTSEPAQCSAGTVSVDVGTLSPGQSAVLTFGVQINR
jgi:trimeric autotransporter adhesin